MRQPYRLLLLLSILVLPRDGQAAVIDFEGLARFETVDDQFVPLGIDFNGTANTAMQGSGLSNLFPPYSGVMVIGQSELGPVPGPGVIVDGIIRIDAVGAPWELVGAFVTNGHSTVNVTLTAFDALGNVLGSDVHIGRNHAQGPGTPNHFISVSAEGIAYATFVGAPNFFTLDDVTFVPEPSTALLVAAGLGGLAARSKARSARARASRRGR